MNLDTCTVNMNTQALVLEAKEIKYFGSQPASYVNPDEPHLRIADCYIAGEKGITFLKELPENIEAELRAIQHTVFSN